MENKRNSFSSSLGFVLAAAGSAVGLGNIWRFPYLAAKDGGGLFLVIYILLALTFGFTMIVSETSIVRKTKQSALTAYGTLHRPSKWIGVCACIVPFMIFPYYCLIGGWVLKYAVTFLTGQGSAAADSSYFTNFITGISSPIIFDVIFLAATAVVIFLGVNKGIETLSKILMPVLLILVVGIAIFSLTIKGGEEGRTGLDGLKVYLIPDFADISFKQVFVTIMDAMGQLFYSISVAMGIMVTYGSYFKDESNLMRSVNQIEIFDTVVAFLAGVMIIPAVFVFLGKEGMSAGPGLMFVALPKVFEAMGPIGSIIGPVFFVMVLLAALTSSMSILETVVASLMDAFGWSRRKAVILESSLGLIISIVICLGYNVLYFEAHLLNQSPDQSAQLLDIFDYVSNNILMPIVAIGTCILVGWIVKPQTIIDEATKNGEKFNRKTLYIAMVKYVAPVMLLFLLLGAFGVFNKVMG
ncbi:MAG: sodium-dependent transporter [Oscillospiraceae bacterium]|nr:sodium-dependent transporter [Oscillospiraceae bacterium]